VFETSVDQLTCGPEGFDDANASLAVYGGVTDFFDYPIHLLDEEQLAMDASSYARAEPLLSNALAALSDARMDGDNRVAVYISDIEPPSNVHPRTPEPVQ
jgi:hypothetical protein